MSDTTTPALKLAGALYAIAEHLVEHPHVPYVVMHRALGLQISSYPGEPSDAHAVLLWAKTLTDVTIVLSRHGGPEQNRTMVTARGRIGEHQVDVWDINDGDLYRWRETELETPITLDQLAAYVAAGTVEHAGEFAVTPISDVVEAEILPCCDLHKDEGCCDPDDCGPCCENCPTCPTLLQRSVPRASADQ